MLILLTGTPNQLFRLLTKLVMFFILVILFILVDYVLYFACFSFPFVILYKVTLKKYICITVFPHHQLSSCPYLDGFVRLDFRHGC